MKTKQKFWDIEEIEKLKLLFPNNKSIDISIKLGRSERSVSKKAYLLGLKKTKFHKSKMIGSRNKMLGRDLSYDNLKEIALLYNSRAEFQMLDSSAYQSARRQSILDDICGHMIIQSFSIPQLILKYILHHFIDDYILYNTRKVIKPYEIDIYFPKYKIAFEYNGKGWHLNDRISKIDICKEKGIKLFIIKENSRNYELDIKSQLILILEDINLICGKEISEHDINELSIPNKVFSNILNNDMISNICNKYNDYSEFRIENVSLYNKIRRLGYLEKYTNHMKRKLTKWDENMIVETVNKYEYLGDLIRDNPGCYSWIKKNRKEYLLKDLKLKQNKKLKYG